MPSRPDVRFGAVSFANIASSEAILPARLSPWHPWHFPTAATRCRPLSTALESVGTATTGTFAEYVFDIRDEVIAYTVPTAIRISRTNPPTIYPTHFRKRL